MRCFSGAAEPASAADRRREWEDKMTYAERESIDAFLRLPTPQRLIVRDVIATYAKAHGAVEPGKGLAAPPGAAVLPRSRQASLKPAAH